MAETGTSPETAQFGGISMTDEEREAIRTLAAHMLRRRGQGVVLTLAPGWAEIVGEILMLAVEDGQGPIH